MKKSMSRWEAAGVATHFLRWMSRVTGRPLTFSVRTPRPADKAIRAQVAGSVRRGVHVVGDIDIVVCLPAGVRVPSKKDEVKRVRFESGDQKMQTWSVNGCQVNVFYTTPGSYGAALLYATGSKDFNKKMRAIAKRKGMKLNRHGLFDLDDNPVLDSPTEGEIFEHLGMDFVLPEERG